MEVMKSTSAALAKLNKAMEADARDAAQPVLPVHPVQPAQPSPPSAAEAGELCGDVVRAGAASVTEIEKLMGELQAARDYLQIEGERLQREAARYAHLTQSALASVKMVSESMDKWRETVPSNLAKVA